MTPNDQMRLALEAKVSTSTIRAYLRGDSIRPAMEEAIRNAALRLRLAAERGTMGPKRKRVARRVA